AGARMAMVAGEERARQLAVQSAPEPAKAAVPARAETTVQDLLQIDPVELEVGYGLIPLVDDRHGGDLLERIPLLRKQAAVEVGILVPRIRIRDDMRLAANEYVVRLRGAEVARAEVLPRMVLALDAGGVTRQVDGIPARDPSFDLPGVWIDPAGKDGAEAQ